MSPEEQAAVSKIEKYIRQIKENHKVHHALERLQNIPMTISLLKITGVGKVVNSLRDQSEQGKVAQQIVHQWKEIAKKAGITEQVPTSSTSTAINGSIKKEIEEEEDRPPVARVKQEIVSSDEEMEQKSRRSKREAKRGEKILPVVTIKKEIKTETEDLAVEDKKNTKNNEKKRSCGEASFSGASPPKKKKTVLSGFELALEAAVKQKSKAEKWKPKPKSNEQPKTSTNMTNYRPLPSLPPIDLTGNESVHALVKGPTTKKDAFDESEMFRPRNKMTKIFAGRRKAGDCAEVPRLFDLCTRFITSHLNELECTGNIPFFVLKPILEKATQQQLMTIERKNPYLEEDSDELWERFATAKYADQARMKGESWKKAFIRFEQQNKNKLKRLAKLIEERKEDAASLVRGTRMMTEEKAPPGIRRKQIKNGTLSSSREAPDALQVTTARKEIFNTGSKSAFASLPSGVRNLSSSLGSSSEKKKNPPKKAVLMQKTLKMLGQKRR